MLPKREALAMGFGFVTEADRMRWDTERESSALRKREGATHRAGSGVVEGFESFVTPVVGAKLLANRASVIAAASQQKRTTITDLVDEEELGDDEFGR